MLNPKLKTEPLHVKPQTAKLIKQEAKERKMKVCDYLEYLVEFEDMEHIDDVARRLRVKDSQGFNLIQIVHLSVLYTLIKQFARDYPLWFSWAPSLLKRSVWSI